MVHNTYKNRYAIRHGDWVLINHRTGADRQPPAAWREKHFVPPYGDQPVGLFNLRNDPGQRNNLAKEHPEKVAELQALLKTIQEQGRSAPRLTSR
jgi:arylsulfatase A